MGRESLVLFGCGREANLFSAVYPILVELRQAVAFLFLQVAVMTGHKKEKEHQWEVYK